MTAGDAGAMARRSADRARDQLAAEICVYRFEGGPDMVGQLALLRDAESWQRTDILIDGGWVTIPGLHPPARAAARLCASRLLSIHSGDGSARGRPASLPRAAGITGTDKAPL